MKSDFKTKLIQHMLNKKNGEKGFTLIELLVVIIIIGILAAIALPSFLNQTSKAKQTEAKLYVATVNKTQQAYFTEKGTFAPGLTFLSLGTPVATDNYSYATLTNSIYATATAASSLKPNLKAYVGRVATGIIVPISEVYSNSIICETGTNSSPATVGAADIPTGGGNLNAVVSPTTATVNGYQTCTGSTLIAN
jgi:prepilin-type N-terminal cleavage/methylation domain-containing protein